MGLMLIAAAIVAAMQVPANMAVIPSGTARRLMAPAGTTVHLRRFAIDRDPVTRGEFQHFVAAHANWTRDAVNASNADDGYLADWNARMQSGTETLHQPVTSVSWYAAGAYCAAHRRRLPTTDEWEYVARASETSRDGSHDEQFRARVLGYYSDRSSHALPSVASGRRNAYGVRGLHDLVWEWTSNAGQAAEHAHDFSCAGAAIGSPDPSNYPAFLRFAFRSGLTPRTTSRSLGFRCATDLPPTA